MSRVASTSAITDADAGIRIVVAPAQSSYFAGEPLTVDVTFTNVRSVLLNKPGKPAHKRAAHSISSAPLSKPPTSPGPPRTPPNSSSSSIEHPAVRKQNSLPTRHGLIGKAAGNGAQGLLEERRKELMNGKRPLSITIGEAEAQEIKSASLLQSKLLENQCKVL